MTDFVTEDNILEHQEALNPFEPGTEVHALNPKPPNHVEPRLDCRTLDPKPQTLNPKRALKGRLPPWIPSLSPDLVFDDHCHFQIKPYYGYFPNKGGYPFHTPK